MTFHIKVTNESVAESTSNISASMIWNKYKYKKVNFNFDKHFQTELYCPMSHTFQMSIPNLFTQIDARILFFLITVRN